MATFGLSNSELQELDRHNATRQFVTEIETLPPTPMADPEKMARTQQYQRGRQHARGGSGRRQQTRGRGDMEKPPRGRPIPSSFGHTTPGIPDGPFDDTIWFDA